MMMNSFVQECINVHMLAFRHWNEGEMVEWWEDDNNVLCIKYQSGNWWHYDKQNNEIVWW